MYYYTPPLYICIVISSVKHSNKVFKSSILNNITHINIHCTAYITQNTSTAL